MSIAIWKKQIVTSCQKNSRVKRLFPSTYRYLVMENLTKTELEQEKKIVSMFDITTKDGRKNWLEAMYEYEDYLDEFEKKIRKAEKKL